MLSFLILIALLFLGTLGITLTQLRQKKELLNTTVAQKTEISDHLQSIATSLKTATELLPSMLPLHEFTEARDLVTSITEKLNSSRNESIDLHDQLMEKQREVEKKELRQSQIKGKREECMSKADEIAGNRQELEAEFDRLQMELEQSRSQMNSLSDEVELKQDQKKIVAEISASLISSCQHMEKLQIEYQESCDRLLSLEHQYKELETEYARLVEKELDKNPWMKVA